MSKGNEKKYNPSLAPLKKSRTGNLSWVVTDEVYEQIMNQVAIGGRILVRMNPQNSKADAYLDFIPREDVERFKKEAEKAEANAEEEASL